MTTSQSIKKLISDIKKDPAYKNWKEHFESWISIKDRTNDTLYYYLVYDIEHQDYKMRSEYNINFNQIALIKASVPPKRDKDKPVEYKTFEYKEKQPE